MIPLDLWDDLRPPLDDEQHCTECGLDRPGGCHCGHYVVEFGWWDSTNLMCKCACGWIGLRTTGDGIQAVWGDHITDQAKLARTLQNPRPGSSASPPLPAPPAGPTGGAA